MDARRAIVATSIPDNSGSTQARRLEAVAEQLTALLRQPDVAQRLRAEPSENEWSAMQILAHMVEMIPYWLDDCQTLVAAAVPPRFGRSLDAPERLAGVARGTAGNSEELLRQLNDEVQVAAKAIRDMSPEDRAKTGIHVRLGTMTVANSIEQFMVVHAEEHLSQIRAALNA
jgi:uncharacterized damage-inducible protein DinB